MHSFTLLTTILAVAGITKAQQYIGDFINNSLPLVAGTEITYFRIPDPAGKNNNLTLINYYSHGKDGNRIVESKIQRAVIVIHGLNRDPYTYQANALSALYQITDPNINFDTVAVISPYFPNGDDKNIGYPWTTGLAAGQGSTTNALVWPGSQWSAGGLAQYPYASKGSISSFYVLDTLVKYFDNTTLFPNMKQIVVAGHSLGAQTVHRYAAIGNQLNTKSPMTYWVANPNSYIWMNTTRPFDTTPCPIYDVYRDGFTNFTQYPMTYATALVAQGRAAILNNFNTKGLAYARGLQDLGDDSSNCAPFTTGGNRNERFFNFIKAFPPSCTNPASRSCDTIDLINVGHDSGQMMASPAGQTRLFIDNFYGNASRAFDFGYPRIQTGDDPFPDPVLNSTVAPWNNNTYAGNMTYVGCYSDQQPATLSIFSYDNSSNTIELCTQQCSSQGYSIAGVEYGSQCFCSNALSFKAQRTVESSCGMTCAGNANETCGGINRISIFSTGTPVQLGMPTDPNRIGAYQFANCYTEVPGRALTDASTTSSNMTLDNCASFCSGYKYWGTEYGSECYCGNTLVAGANVTASTDCSQLCAGNPLQLCGNANRLSVYTLAPVVSSSTSSSTPTPSATPAVCPQSNNTVITSNGQNFLVECNIDHYGGDLSYVAVNGLQQCIDTCAMTNNCIDVSLSGTACYMKSSLGTGNVNTGVNGAKFVGYAGISTSSVTTSSTALASSTSVVVVSTSTTSSTTTSSITTSSSTSAVVTSTSTSSSISSLLTTTSTTTSAAAASSTVVTCPASNNTIVNSINGTSFFIECGIDHFAGDMGLVYVSTFLDCITACANNTGCVDVSLNGQACYMKSTLGAPGNNNAVWGAKLIAVAPSTTSAVSPSTPASTVSLTTSTVTSSQTSSTFLSVIQTTSSSVLSTSTTLTTSTITTISSTTLVTSTKSTTSSSTSTFSSVSGYAYPTLAPGFSYVGCYVDGGNRVFSYSNGSSSTQTPQNCASTCRGLGYRYAGAEYSSECWCSNYLTAASAPDTDCANTCSGDAKQNCGGGYRLSVVVDNNWTQTLFARQTYNTWNIIGCYQDNVDGRDLPNLIALPGGASSATIANCLSACAGQGYKYCGAEYYSECYGSNTAPSIAVLPGDPLAAGCNYPCTANSTEACGGNAKLTVYVNNGS